MVRSRPPSPVSRRPLRAGARPRSGRGRGPGAVFAALAALVLSLRVVGAALALVPEIGAGAQAGLIPICTGTEIVWISLAEAGPDFEGAPSFPAGDDGHAPDPCPWFGLVAAMAAPAAPEAPPRPTVSHAPPPAASRAAAPAPAAAFFRSRAPPVPA